MKRIISLAALAFVMMFLTSATAFSAIPPVGGDEGGDPPETFVLFQNYPNPFNPVTTIKYEIKEAQDISIKVYDLLAREVASLEEGYKETGVYEITFDARDLPSGIYFYSLQTNDARVVRQMTLLK